MILYVINKARNMKNSDEQKLKIIKKVIICTDDQLQKVNEYISSLWREEEEKEEQFKKEYAEWKEKKENSMKETPAL